MVSDPDLKKLGAPGGGRSGYSLEFCMLEEMYKFLFLQVENLCFTSGGLYPWLYFYCRISIELGNFSEL